MNTKAECKHYKGKIWLNGEIGKRGNICADTGQKEMMVIAYRPIITEENIVSAIKAMGWFPESWLGEDFNKKEFQKVIKAIRKTIHEKAEFPKAMMTGQQEAKRTATVNCGGERLKPEEAHKIVMMVMGNKEFQILMWKYNCEAIRETNSFGAEQIRINY